MSFKNVGKVWTASTFEDYLKGLKKPTWCNKITLHHTAAPSLAQRPKGFTIQHIVNIRDFYKTLGRSGWSSGPHLFIDDDQIFGMTPLNEKGIHAVSFNSTSIGIEVLGDYDTEDPLSGRGLECWKTACDAVRILCKWLNITPSESTIKFHRDDPRTSKTCPGTKVSKEWVLDMISNGEQSTTSTNIHKCECVCDEYGVVDYVVEFKGYTEQAAVKQLKRKNGLFYFGDIWLESARYNKDEKKTVALKSDLSEIKHI